MHVRSDISSLNRGGHRISALHDRRVNKGMGDWFSPSCPPGSAGCVPHWYCYIPGMATTDCLASLGQGISEVTQGVASTAGSAVGAVAGGVTSGTCLAALGNGDLAQSICNSSGLQWALVGIAVVVGYMVLQK